MNKNAEKIFFTIEDYEPQLWSCLNCYCGLCIAECPAYIELKNYSVTPRGLSQIGLSILTGEIGLSDLSDEIVYSCTGCRWCEWECSQNMLPIIKNEGTRLTRVSGATITEMFRCMKVETGDIPPQVRDALRNIAKYGNPLGGSKNSKDNWVDSLKLNKDVDTILYVSSLVPYESRATQMAEAIIRVLKKGIDFAMIGSQEMDSGAFPLMMGEEGLFLEIMENNLKTFQKAGIKQIICVSPHDYDVLVNHYRNMEDIKVRHYSEVLWEIIKTGKIKFNKKIGKKITYHDPCYLGRKLNIYDDPRRILQNIPGTEFVEMKKTGKKHSAAAAVEQDYSSICQKFE